VNLRRGSGDRPIRITRMRHDASVVKVLVVIMIAGCHLGTGPVIAYSPQDGFRAGLETSGGLGFVRGSLGATWAPVGNGPTRRYVTFDPGYAHRVGRVVRNDGEDSYEIYLGGGATIGKAYGPDQDGLAVGVWTTGTMFDYSCEQTNFVFTIAIGYRVLANIGELFIAPKANLYGDPFKCWR
jgi:hypothetical protein